MKFEYKEQVNHPLEQVYPVLRDQLEQLPQFLDGVDYIEELEREDLGNGRHRIVNVWHGNAGSAPPPVRPFVTKKMTTWTDYALWDDNRSLIEWRFETNHFETLYACSGINYLEDNGTGGTQLRLTGTLEIYAERVPGVPKLLARKLKPAVETFLINMVTPNLKEMPRAIQAFLDQADSP